MGVFLCCFPQPIPCQNMSNASKKAEYDVHGTKLQEKKKKESTSRETFWSYKKLIMCEPMQRLLPGKYSNPIIHNIIPHKDCTVMIA